MEDSRGKTENIIKLKSNKKRRTGLKSCPPFPAERWLPDIWKNLMEENLDK